MQRLRHLFARPWIIFGITTGLTLATLVSGIVTARGELTYERAAQAREVQEGFSGLHRELAVVSKLASNDSKDHAAKEFLVARRSELSSVRWLGIVPPAGPLRVLLDTTDTRGFDPRHDNDVASALTSREDGALTATAPATYGNAANLALILGGDNRQDTLVALIDGDDLLDDSLRAMAKSSPHFTVAISNHEIGHWPTYMPSDSEHEGSATTVPMASLMLTLHFTQSDSREILHRLSASPLAVFFAGLTLCALMRRRPVTLQPVQPTHSPDLDSRPFHRARLWHLGELAASLSHDLGQPLNVIRLTAEAAHDSVTSGAINPERLGRSLSTVVDQVRRAQTLMDGLIAASRRSKTPPRPISAVEATRKALAQSLPRIKAHSLRLLWHADLNTPPVFGHADRLRAAIAHVLLNACEALASQKAQHGIDGCLEVDCRLVGDCVTISIADNGPGLPPAVDADLTAITVSAEAGKSLGLGLTVALGVTAEMGGRLTVAERGNGTHLLLRFPPAGRSVLIVDDDTDAATELAAFLDAHGWRTRIAHGGHPAFKLFGERRPDAIITDLHMDDGDGWQLIERVRPQAPFLPIVAVSTVDGGDAQRALDLGATRILRKPLGVQEVVNELEALTAIK